MKCPTCGCNDEKLNNSITHDSNKATRYYCHECKESFLVENGPILGAHRGERQYYDYSIANWYLSSDLDLLLQHDDNGGEVLWITNKEELLEKLEEKYPPYQGMSFLTWSEHNLAYFVGKDPIYEGRDVEKLAELAQVRTIRYSGREISATRINHLRDEGYVVNSAGYPPTVRWGNGKKPGAKNKPKPVVNKDSLYRVVRDICDAMPDPIDLGVEGISVKDMISSLQNAVYHCQRFFGSHAYRKVGGFQSFLKKWELNKEANEKKFGKGGDAPHPKFLAWVQKELKAPRRRKTIDKFVAPHDPDWPDFT